MLAVLAVAVVAAGLATLARLPAPDLTPPGSARDLDVELPADARPGPTTDDDAGGGNGSDGTTGDGDRAPTPCFPGGCPVWVADEVDHRNVWVGDDLAVHAGRSGLLGIDLDTGAVRWRRPGGDATAAFPWHYAVQAAVDRDGVAVVDDRVLRVHDPLDGRPRGELVLPFERLHDLRWSEGVLQVTGGGWQAAGPDVLLFVSADATLQHAEEGLDGVALLDEDTLLTLDGDRQRLRLRGASDGAVRWESAGRSVWATVGATVVHAIDDDGAVTSVDRATGAQLATTGVEGHDRPEPLDDWLLVRTDEGRTLVDPRAGSEPVRLPPAPRRTPGAAVAVQDRVVFAEVTAGGDLAVVAADRDGGGASELLVAGDDLDARSRVEDHVLQVPDAPSDVVDVVLGGGRVLVRLSVDPLEVVAVDRRELPTGAQVAWHDGVTLVRHAGVTRVLGTAGSVELPGTVEVAATDPLLLHGSPGLLRLDRRTLFDTAG